MPRAKGGGLSKKQALFVEEYLIDLNATQAALRAKYSAKWVKKNAHRMTAKDGPVKRAIDAAIAKRNERLRLSQDDIVREWQTIATADPRHLVEYRRTCCRYCHGSGFDYQRTKGEMAREYEAWKKDQPKPRKGKLALVDDEPPIGGAIGFDQKGGIGYDKRKPPHPDCPECFGEGVAAAFINDTRTLSPEAARLYAGVQETNTGIKVAMRDQDAALANLAKHSGMFKDRVEVTGSLDLTPAAVAREILAAEDDAAKRKPKP